jgi:hypothetical protein
MKVIKLSFFQVLNNIGFPMKGKLIRSNYVFGVYRMRFRIHRYVAAPPEAEISKNYCAKTQVHLRFCLWNIELVVLT